MADQLTSLAGGKAQQVDIIKTHAVRGNAPVIFSDTTDGLSDQTFT